MNFVQLYSEQKIVKNDRRFLQVKGINSMFWPQDGDWFGHCAIVCELNDWLYILQANKLNKLIT